MAKYYISILSILILFSSCDSRRVFDESIVLPEEGWYNEDAASFNINIEDVEVNYNLYFNVRNTTDYNWQNAYFFINTYFPNNQLSRDTIEVQFADYKGKWLGNGIGKIKDNSILLRKNIIFPMKGDYRFEIFHGMRKDTIFGISDVGLRIEKAQMEL